MKLKFSWLKSRKSLFFSTFIDLSFYSLFFLKYLKLYFINLVLLILTLLNTFTWVISSYLVGRYTNFQGKRTDVIIIQFIKTFLIILSNLLLTQIFLNYSGVGII